MKFIKNIFIVLFVVVFITGCGNNAPKNENGTKYDYEATNPYENVVEGTPTFISANKDETHKGVIYLDPTNLNRLCTKEDAEKNINTNGTSSLIKRGCMKWYVINNEGNDYTLLLDHNTEVSSYWYNGDEQKKIPYEDSDIKKEVDKLASDYNWKVNPRLITLEEIFNIVYNGNNNASYYYEGGYIDSELNHDPTSFELGHSKYDWLFNNTSGCGYQEDSKVDGVNINYGCTIEDNNFYKVSLNVNSVINGYWTSTLVPRYSAGNVYTITRQSTISFEATNRNIPGIRPVITISKSVINGGNNNTNEKTSGLLLNKYYVDVYEENPRKALSKKEIWTPYLKFLNDNKVEINYACYGEGMCQYETKYETYFENEIEYVKIYETSEMKFLCSEGKEYALLKVEDNKLNIITSDENNEGLDMAGVREYKLYEE